MVGKKKKREREKVCVCVSLLVHVINRFRKIIGRKKHKLAKEILKKGKGKTYVTIV
jgi:hypothetical protein